MKTIRQLFLVCFVFAATARGEELLVSREWKIGGVTREALLHIPATAKTNVTPLVFAFHGHGGSMQRAAKMFHIETLWPEAIVVYMNGLNTPGHLTDPEGKKPGWQRTVGDQNDRDLKFFDAVMTSLAKEFRVDKKRVYSTGHSNGGAFTYLLWEARGDQFAAFAPSAAASRSLIQLGEGGQSSIIEKKPGTHRAFIPKPVLHVAGENDPLVKFVWQKMMIEALRTENQCGESKPWKTDKRCSIYSSKVDAPVVTYIHPGTHQYPAEAPDIIVKFFRGYAQPNARQKAAL